MGGGVCLLFWLSAVGAQEQATITVLDFKTNNVSDSDMRSIISLLSSAPVSVSVEPVSHGLGVSLGFAYDASGNYSPGVQISAVPGEAIYALTLAADPEDAGTVEADPVGIEGVYAPDATVSLTPIPAFSYRFDHWEGDVPEGHENDNPLSVTMTEDRSITAVFVARFVVERVADMNPPGASNPTQMAVYDGVLCFQADGGVHGQELWSYDGTTVREVYDGTNPPALAVDVLPGADSSDVQYTAQLAARMYFQANDGVSGPQLWEWDYVSEPRIVEGINPSGASSPSHMTVFGDSIVFGADDGSSGMELWRLRLQ